MWRSRTVQTAPPIIKRLPVGVDVLIARSSGLADLDVVDGVNLPQRRARWRTIRATRTRLVRGVEEEAQMRQRRFRAPRTEPSWRSLSGYRRKQSLGLTATRPLSDLWKRFEAVCSYETPANLPEFQRVFLISSRFKVDMRGLAF